MRMKISLSLDCLTYRLDGQSEKWPIPWGVSRTGWAHVSGRPRASRAGAWYYQAPRFSVIGYGHYEPYCEFLFKGEVERTSRRDDIPAGGAGFRVGQSTWLYFRGIFRPTPRALLEQRLAFNAYYDLGTAAEVLPLVGTQGQLSLRCLSGEELSSEIRLLERISSSFRRDREVFPHRRRIIEHQFFGEGVRVYFLPYVPEVHGTPEAEYQDQLQWLVWVPSEAKVVSPDHLDQPIHLVRGLYWATHPRPAAKGVD
jgi:hypothetical protein